MDIPHYTLVEKKEVPEYHLTGYLFRHDLTGARLFFAIAPGDDNKVFSATFLSRPDNDCGVPHILEHCMLNGSDKYPVKEPFVELLKGSLNTFLNAMTFPDKTMFPVASRNDKDFENLMDVYLDAVFHPRLLKDPNIFRQEGWHMELNDENEPITYKGVVYNEMKGAYSDPETVLADLVEKAMYPDNAYSKDSGGNPEFIPDLTYDEFCAFYRKYYHPSNSYLFFYGDLDMEYYLDKVDKEYLSTFTKVPETLPAHIDLQRRFEIPVETYGSYGITEDDDPSRKTYLSYSVMLDPVTTAEDYYAIDMLAEIIGGVEASPLKKALIDAGIGQSISVSVDLSRQQPVFEIVAKNAEAFQKDDFVRIIRKTLSDCVQNGYDPDLVEATVASSEFTLREQNYGSTPPGLILNIMVMDSWLYGGDPMQNLFYEKALDHIHKTKGLFEDLTKRLILENHHVVVCVLKPQAGLTLRTEEKTARKLKEYKDSLTPDQIRQLVRTTKEFTAWQQKPDRAEDLDKLPLLKREDLKPASLVKHAFVEQKDGIDISVYEDDTNHVVYFADYFNMDHLPEDLIPYASLLSLTLGMMDTDRFTYTEVDNEIGKRLGSLSFTVRTVIRKDNTFIPYLVLSSKFLSGKTNISFDLIKEILFHTHFDDTARLKEVIENELINMQQNLLYSGSSVALSRCRSYFDPAAAYQQKASGIDYYLFLKDLSANFDQKKEETVDKLKKTLDILARRDNVRIRITAQKDEKDMVEKEALDMLKEAPLGPSAYQSSSVVRVVPEEKDEAFITPGKINFVARCGRFTKPYDGYMAVMGQILSLDYLWNRVRVQGGAYGASKSISLQGNLGMASYRDPNLAKTLKVYEEAAEWGRTFECSEREMTKYIIGTMALLDPVRTVQMKGREAHEMLETGRTDEEILTISRQVMETTPQKVREASAIIGEAMKEPFICVEGSESAIKANQGLFKHIVHLF